MKGNAMISACLCALMAFGAAAAVVKDDDLTVVEASGIRYGVANASCRVVRQVADAIADGAGFGGQSELICRKNDVDDFVLASRFAGGELRSAGADYAIGDALSMMPYAGTNLLDAAEIDWDLTLKGIKERTDRKLMVAAGVEDPAERVRFVGGGQVQVVWYVKEAYTNRFGCAEITNSYNVAAAASERPLRLFWTSKPFNCPPISLQGKFVRLFGDASLFEQYEPSTAAGVSNIVCGVHYDGDSQTLQAIAKSDGNGVYEGPRGQFVLAYYADGKMESYLGSVVVEVSAPDRKTLSAHVGDELQPDGGGWNIDGLYPVLMAGVAADTGDTVAPYLYSSEFTDDATDEKQVAVFAIAPNDSSAYSTGIDAPWKAEVIWEIPDRFGTLWPFEDDMYHLSWNPSDPKVVFSGHRGEGLPLTVSGGPNVEICAYQKPAATASVTNDQIVLNKEGRFTARFSDTSGRVWFMPFQSVPRDGEAMLGTCPNLVDSCLKVPVGQEIRPMPSRFAGWGLEQQSLVDASIPGYIWQKDSPGRNWNHDLYHEPSDTNDADRVFTFVKSAIYPVSPSEEPLEVWWSSVAKVPDNHYFKTQATVSYPCVVNRYRVIPPLKEDIPEIVIASQAGSRGDSSARAGSAVVLEDPSICGTLSSGLDLSGTNGWTVALSLAPELREYQYLSGIGGDLITLESGTDLTVRLGMRAEMDESERVYHAIAVLEPADGTAITNAVAIPTNVWTRIALSCAPTGNGRDFVFSAGGQTVTSSIAAERLGLFDGRFSRVLVGSSVYVPAVNDGERVVAMARGSAAFVGIDELGFWNRTLDVSNTVDPGTAAVYFDFDDTKGDRIRRSRDGLLAFEFCSRAWDKYRDSLADPDSENTGLVTVSPGAPRATGAAGLSAAHDIVPHVYRQTDKGLPGYHLNLAHAFTQAEGDDYTVWAVRSDLAEDPLSDGLVFVNWCDGDKAAMSTYRVSRTNEQYSSFSTDDGIVGKVLLPPKPLCFIEGYWNDHTSWASVTNADNAADGSIVYRDRKKNDWARRDGDGFAYYHYLRRSDFDLPGGTDDIEIGAYMPWLVRAVDAKASLAGGMPCPWHWKTSWPKLASIPVLDIGQTQTSANGLPEVWNMHSCGVVYPRADRTANVGGTVYTNRLVALVDPITAQTAGLPFERDFPSEYGFVVGPKGDVQFKDGKYYFLGVPPTVSERFYLDTTADQDRNLVLIGRRIVPDTGNSYLQLNKLQPNEYQGLLALTNKMSGVEGAAGKWRAAIKAINEKPLIVPWHQRQGDSPGTAELTLPSTLTITNVIVRDRLDTLAQEPGSSAEYTSVTNVMTLAGPGNLDIRGAVKTVYSPAANYALMATGEGAGFVVLIENDSTNTQMVAEGDPVNLHVIRVRNRLYAGDISTQKDGLNKLSELLTVQYNEVFDRAEDEFEFEWWRRDPPIDGGAPYQPVSEPDVAGYGWSRYERGQNRTSFLLGTEGATIDNLKNQYYIMRLKPKNADSVAAKTLGGDGWSDWTKYTLAEGWVQRVLNAVTPFTQRIEDFSSCPADLWYTMLEQIGGPYQGDVALNNDNLTQIGLIELYRTVLNKAEKMSIASRVNDPSVNKQLLLAASRLADLYSVLGAEAYSDAKNPLISQGLDAELLEQLQQLPSSTFCFQNHVPSLLDEELALLRGRSMTGMSPDMITQPCYNRLYWNFTKGITEGEVAYVVNYGIRGTDGVITTTQAKKQYPQGHGDAWGHYLSALTGYYRLLRNPYFGWSPAIMEMIMADAVVSNDDSDEQKFADLSVKLAQTGLDTVDLTARKAWRDNGGEMTAGYLDRHTYAYGKLEEHPEQGFGYGEFAVRTGLGAIYNWAVMNSVLTTNDAPAAVYQDLGIRHITRTTASQLEELCTLVKSVNDKVNLLDSGLNPLGLSDNAVPMDIDPSELESRNSHFDQILARCEKALANCSTVLDFANEFGGRIQQIQNAETREGGEQEAMEEDYNRRLIGIYGMPYSGDIGTGKMYPQGYSGPDLYHYMYMDYGPYGLDVNDIRAATAVTCMVTKIEWNKTGTRVFGASGAKSLSDMRDAYTTNTVTFSYGLSASGFVVKPDSVGGSRLCEGTIQTALREFLSAYSACKTEIGGYETAVNDFGKELDLIWNYINYKDDLLIATESLRLAIQGANDAKRLIKDLATPYFVAYSNKIEDVKITLSGVSPVSGIGTTAVISPLAITEAAQIPQRLLEATIKQTYSQAVSVSLEALDVAIEAANASITAMSLASSRADLRKQYIDALKSQCDSLRSKRLSVRDRMEALVAADAALHSAIADGDTLQAEIQNYRKRQSNKATKYRYMDMYNRVQRNNALTKYSTAFDTAQRYVWELAKVYDYETGLLSGDPQSGKKFLSEIIGARQLGAEGVSTSQATDKGLYDIVNRMKENWSVLKGRLGVNNPDTSTKWFSLRYSNFRIKGDASGDAAWRQELAKYRVEDLRSVPLYNRYCQPPAGADSVRREPGFVIPFRTAINVAENFFGRTLQGGEAQYSSSDYATKIHAVGLKFEGYDALTTQTADGLALEPHVYLVPAGFDYMRSPAGTDRKVLAWNVIDQVLPLPYTVGSTELDDPDWISTFSGLDGTSDSAAVIRRHSTLAADGEVHSTRLVGRSVWNDNWLIIIPGSSLNADREKALDTFLRGVGDIKLGIQAYSRSGN